MRCSRSHSTFCAPSLSARCSRDASCEAFHQHAFRVRIKHDIPPFEPSVAAMIGPIIPQDGVANGLRGLRVVKALLAAGHTVAALSRRTGADLDELDVETVHGSLADIYVITAAAAAADAVFHLGFGHNLDRSAGL